MSVKDVADKFAALCKVGEFDKAADLWSDDVVSIEPHDGPMQICRGRAAVEAKGKWWYDNHEINETSTDGPYVNGDQFALRFKLTVTPKATGQKMAMEEVALYTVRGDRIVEERFFF